MGIRTASLITRYFSAIFRDHPTEIGENHLKHYLHIVLFLLSIFTAIGCESGNLNDLTPLAPEAETRSPNGEENAPDEKNNQDIDKDGKDKTTGDSTELKLVSGDFQDAFLLQTFSNELVIQTMDATGKPAVGEFIYFQAIEGDGTKILNPSVTTDEGGFGRTGVIAGRNEGQILIAATWKKFNRKIEFNLTAKGPGRTLSIKSGDFQTGNPNMKLAGDLVVVAMTNGIPSSRELIKFSTTSFASGTLSTSSVVTGQDGTASVSFTPGPIPRQMQIIASWETASQTVVFNIESLSEDVAVPEVPPFQGCISGQALDTSRILISFQHPPNSTKVRIYRDGLAISEIDDKSVLTTIDRNLSEGVTYSGPSENWCLG